MLKAAFYRDCILKTSWIPMQNLRQEISIGDVMQIRHGSLCTLLNLSEAHLIEPLVISPAIPFGDCAWNFSYGAHQSHTEMQAFDDANGERYSQTRQVLDFLHPGNFLFHATAGHAHLLLNWDQRKSDVILKLTQTHYQFREVYVVTAVATMREWGLVVAGQDEARLEMSAASNSHDQFSLLSHQSARVDVSRGIAHIDIGSGQAAHFFKAKKLILSDATIDRYQTRLAENTTHLKEKQVAQWLNAEMINVGRAADLNLSTCMDYFSWRDMSLNDIAELSE